MTAFETLGAPRVGFDQAATDWARREAFPRRLDKSLTEQAFLDRMDGFYVLDLVPACDGIPRYSNGQVGGYVERYSFRAQFLRDCTEILGEELLESAYESKLPEDTLVYGTELLSSASRFASAHNIDPDKIHLIEESESIEFRLDVVFSAGRWCRYWGERGHWLDAWS